MATLELLYGEKLTPLRSLDLSQSVSTGSILLVEGGLGARSGDSNIFYTNQTHRDGQARLSSARANAQFDLIYMLNGDSLAELGALQRDINRFIEDIRYYEEQRAGFKCWLKVRWDFDDFPEPLFGQLSHYLHVLSIEVPTWGDLRLLNNNRIIVTATLTTGPYAEGVRQLLFWKSQGQLEIAEDGVAVFDAATNKINNPGFGNSTWNTNWTVTGASLIAQQETFYTRSFDSAARLVNTSAGSLTFRQLLTLTAVDYTISCYARNLDGSAVTSSDIVLVGQGSGRTTTFVSVGDGWYYCYATYTGAAASASHGVAVSANKSIIVDDFMLETEPGTEYPGLRVNGTLIGCSWSGTVHASESSRPVAQLTTVLNYEPGVFTTVFWYTPHYELSATAGDRYLFEYYVDANNYLVGFVDMSASAITITKNYAGSSTSDSTGTISLSAFTPMHLAIVQSLTGITIYINGTVDSSLAITTNPTQTAGGDFTLGDAPNVSGTNINTAQGYFDGFRIWGQALTAAQISELYTAEVQIKDNNDVVGLPPYFWTKDGDGILDAVDGVLSSSAKDNWGVVGGVSGDVEAYTEWRLRPSNTSPSEVYWLGLKATDKSFLPYGFLWHDFDTTADSGNSSGDGYDTDTTAGSGTDKSFFIKDVQTDLDKFQGIYQFLTRIKVTGNSADLIPIIQIANSNSILFDTTRVATNSAFLFRDVGQIVINWPQDDPVRIRLALGAYETTASANTHQCDFFALLPNPWCRVEAEDATITTASGDALIIRDDSAWMIDNSTSDEVLYTFHFRGEPVHVRPNKYNYVFVLQGEEGVAYPVSDTVTVTVFYTPRWLLPGSPVG